MKDLLQKYANYNIWANKHFVDLLRICSKEQLEQEITSSFPTLKDTVYHMWSAEDIWIQRLSYVERPVWQAGLFKGDFSIALDNWELASQKLSQFIADKDEATLQTSTVKYEDLKKRVYELPIHIGLMQVLNHATYHRGQLVTMLRSVGFTDMPQTDFHVYMMK